MTELRRNLGGEGRSQNSEVRIQNVGMNYFRSIAFEERGLCHRAIDAAAF